MATVGSPTTPTLSANDTFLKYAPSRSIAITGTIPAASGGGAATGLTTWQAPVPETPVWCDSVDFLVSTIFTLTIAASSSVQISPFAPYSGFSIGFRIAGAAPWPVNEATPFLFDNDRRTRAFDPGYPGLGEKVATGGVGYLGKNNVLDFGPYGQNFNTAAVAPGVTITNTLTVAAVYTLTWTFSIHIQLQQLETQLWGMVPFGDPKNRIETIFQLNPLAGTTPEQNLVVVLTGTATCTVGSGAPLSVIAVYNVRDIDVLPDGVSAPQVTVGLGLTLNFVTVPITAAGVITQIQHTDAIAYTSLDHILVNALQALRADYFGLWLTQEQKSARWSFDAADNTLGEYWEQFRRKYHRYPYLGHYEASLARGNFPDLPGTTPYDGIMSPDDTYAAMFGAKATPLMQTAIRIPTGTSISAAYARAYETGLTKVSY